MDRFMVPAGLSPRQGGRQPVWRQREQLQAGEL